ncbi:hypothetical protein UP10_33255 [Bradyrhizobium sp. LTSPM299]|nr:hypothetical protein UP10_33255 [Bradyrhizobium sp. LTSPM299]
MAYYLQVKLAPGERKVGHQITACLILAILATSDVQTTASADELAKFNSVPFIMGQIQQRQSARAPRSAGERARRVY